MFIPWHKLEIETNTRFYEVCFFEGLVRSVDKKTGDILILKGATHGTRKTIRIGDRDYLVHILVAMAFHEKPPDYDASWTVDHIDPDQPDNNDASNLRWANLEMQAINRRRSCRIQIDSCPCIAINGDKIIEFSSIDEAASITPGGHASAISMCLSGKRNKHAGMTWKLPNELPDFSGEMWKSKIKTHKYEILVSNYGRIGYKFTNGYFKKVSSFDKMTKRAISDTDGYPRINIAKKSYALHRLVYETFTGPIPAGMIVHHIDHVKLNAHVDNLELVTQSENLILAHDAGKFDGTKSERIPVLINGVKYTSAYEAARRLYTYPVKINDRIKSNTFPEYQKM